MRSADPRSASAMRRRPPGPVARRVITAAAVLALAFPAGQAWAQNPSGDQMIDALRRDRVVGVDRGIHNVGPPGQPVAAAAPEARARRNPAHPGSGAPGTGPVVSDTGGKPAVNLTVTFASGSARLTPAATKTLDELGRALSSSTLAADKFRIEGHTDTVGGADMNKTLSEQRANAVVDYLVTRFNIDRGRLTAAGMGEEGLLIQTPPETPEPRNRRVQVVNVST